MLEEGISLPGRPSGRPSGTATGSDAETNPGPGAGAGADAGAGANDDLEPLACVTCRSRKLKCDRSKPACLRCTRLKSDCVYPESRRKPALKRRNVKELEERLAQVEVLLKDAAGETALAGQNGRNVPVVNMPPDPISLGFDQNISLPISGFQDHSTHGVSFVNAASIPLGWDFETSSPNVNGDNPPDPVGPSPPSWGHTFSFPDEPFKPQAEEPTSAAGYELLGLGMFEALPPAEMIEELHQTYFTKRHPLIPIVHPGRYIQAFYSAPHLRPPMALQYAIWTMATNGHERFAGYHDAFYRRCRHYLQEDELRGEGEHFLTVAHAQAWALIATDEARRMSFTRAAMSAARCIKLLHMMGLHRLDDPDAEFEMAPTIAPPRDWTELEERRRVFWGAFAIDSHAAISTGWPTLIDMGDVTTHLPSSEEAFASCQEEAACRLEDVFQGATYSSFAGAAVVCHVFNQIMQHVHRSRPDDRRGDYEYGRWWNRHRELDNLLSSAFMFLPERFRLPTHVRDPVAVHTNLNLHASLICLHNSAYEVAREHDLPAHIRHTTMTRLSTTAQEVVNIIKLTSHSSVGFRSPLVALALYVASSVYISQAQDDILTPRDTANLQFLLTAMTAIGKVHHITQSFLHQVVLDLRRAGLDRLIPNDLPPGISETIKSSSSSSTKGTTRAEMGSCGYSIPLFARSGTARRAGIMPPLPGRLPLNNPIGSRGTDHHHHVCSAEGEAAAPQRQIPPPPPPPAAADAGGSGGGGNKRRRVALSPEGDDGGGGRGAGAVASSGTGTAPYGPSVWFAHSIVEEEDVSPPPDTTETSYHHSYQQHQQQRRNQGVTDSANLFRLPHRGGGGGGGGDGSSTNTTTTNTVGSGTTTSGTSPSVAATNASRSTPNDSSSFISAEGVMGGGVAMADLFQGLNGWDEDRVNGDNDNNNNNNNNNSIDNNATAAAACPQQYQQRIDPAALYAQQVAGDMLGDDSWMVLNDTGIGVDISAGGDGHLWGAGVGGS